MARPLVARLAQNNEVFALARFTEAFAHLAIDTTRMHAAIGPALMPWKQGILSMVRALALQLLREGYR